MEAEVCPLYINDGRANKSNYQPINILFNASKICERYLYRQLYDYFDKNICSKYQGGFRKGFRIQPSSHDRKKPQKTARDNKEFCAAILTDLPKAFDCICNDILTAKLSAYGFDRNALKLIYDYLVIDHKKLKQVFRSVPI